MRRAPGLLLALLCLIPTGRAAAMDRVDFSLPSDDGRTHITGEIDLPDAAKTCQDCRYPLVVMVPGSGLFDRDGLFGTTGTDRDFMFRDLAQSLAAAGIASLRYDYRGISCNQRTAPPCPDCTADQRVKSYVTHCLDNAVRSTVTMANIDDDIALVYHYGASQPQIDPSRVVLLAHSEGTLHAARLVGAGRLSPKGLLLIGMLAESPEGIIKWQMVDRQLRILDWSTSHNGVLTNDDIKAGFVKDPYFADLGYKVDNLLSPTGSWTRESLLAALTKQYEGVVQDALAHADDAPYATAVPGQTGLEVVLASYAWWKDWFTDQTPAVDLLRNYPGEIVAHNGDNDSQTPGVREFSVLDQAAPDFVEPPRAVLHPGVGHGLSHASPLLGPIDPAIKQQIIGDLEALTAAPKP